MKAFKFNRFSILVLLTLPLTLGVVALLGIGFLHDSYPELEPGLKSEFVGSKRCIECHEELGQRWAASYHAKSMDVASPQTVRADFHDTTCEHFGVTTRFSVRDGRYFVATDEPSEEYAIRYVLGIYPLQQYLVQRQDGRVQCLPFAWDVEGKKWFHLYPNEKLPLGDELHWLSPAQNWNYACATCHVTGLERNFNFQSNEYHTTFREIQNGCESCHGPGSVHVQLAEQKNILSKMRKGRPFQDPIYGEGLFSFRTADAEAAVDACCVCHARRKEIYPGFQPGARFSDYYFPELLDSEAFFCDGQIREEDFEYTSFLQSACSRSGGRCGDCHSRPIAPIRERRTPEEIAQNVKRMCAPCHDLAKYDTPVHHHHDPQKALAGTRCEDCHLPARTYMGVDVRRDHSIQIPKPRLTQDLGVPNACNDCHHDSDRGQTPAWALSHLEKWYGPRPVADHFAYAIHAGRKNLPEGGVLLCNVLKNRELSPIVRASAAALLERYEGENVRICLISGLKDDSEWVRAMCVRALERKFRNPEELRAVLCPMLSDPVRCVRLEAVRQLVGVPLDGRFSSAFQAARAEYLESQRNLPEQPASHLNLAVMSERLGETASAERAYRDALKLDPAYLPARNNLAMLLYATGRAADAENEFRAITQQHPDSAEGWYSLGLLVAENPARLPEAAEFFDRATLCANVVPRMFYNLGVTLLQTGDRERARTALERAIQLEPENREFREALQFLEIQKARGG